MTVGGQARLAGVLYLVIIVAGIWGEAVARGGLIVADDAEATAALIRGSEGLFRASLLADLLMALCDAGVAVLLFLLLRPCAPAAALAAMVFRLVQTAVITTNMLVTAAALAFAGGMEALTLAMMELRGLGYDIGLGFFGVCNAILGVIFLRIAALPTLLGWLLSGSGIVYLIGTTLHLVAPAILPAFQLAYLLPVAAETVFAFWLLLRGGRTFAAASAGRVQ